MKNLKLLALSLSILIFISCGGDDPGPSGNSMSASVSGAVSASFEASGEIQGQQLVQANVTAAGEGEALSIVATTATGSAMSMAITNYTGVGTYSLAATSGNTFSFTSVNTSTFETKGFVNESGSVEITSAGESISGTFTWEGVGNNGGNVENVSVTGGNFSVTPNEPSQGN